MSYQQTLYKSDSSGKIRQWDIWTEGNVIHIEHGLQNGKRTHTTKVIESGKNLGRSNETTPEEQAQLEAASTAAKKMDSGYCQSLEHVNVIDVGHMPLPMLAHSYDKRGKDILWPAHVQPKLDGIRCMATLNPCSDDDNVVLYSRKGKIFEGDLTHIKEALAPILEEDWVLDGELYTKELTFQELTGAVKRSRAKAEKKGKEFCDHYRLIEYHIFDCFNPMVPDEPWASRESTVRGVVAEINNSCIIAVDTHTANDEQHMRDLHQVIVSQGYEGTIIRNLHAPYKVRHRSTDLQKFKDFQDEEYEIVGAEVAREFDVINEEYIDTVVWICQTDDGSRFNVRPKGTRQQRVKWLQDKTKYIGIKLLTVRYQELTDDGIPRFPVGIGLRDYE